MSEQSQPSQARVPGRVPVRIRTEPHSFNKYLRKTIVELESGERIKGIRSVQINAGIPGVPGLVTATIEAFVQDVDVHVDGEILVTALPSGRRFRLVPLKTDVAQTPSAVDSEGRS